MHLRSPPGLKALDQHVWRDEWVERRGERHGARAAEVAVEARQVARLAGQVHLGACGGGGKGDRMVGRCPMARMPQTKA